MQPAAMIGAAWEEGNVGADWCAAHHTMPPSEIADTASPSAQLRKRPCLEVAEPI